MWLKEIFYEESIGRLHFIAFCKLVAYAAMQCKAIRCDEMQYLEMLNMETIYIKLIYRF